MARMRWPSILALLAAVVALAWFDACRHLRPMHMNGQTGAESPATTSLSR
jgi:hypothetical protein